MTERGLWSMSRRDPSGTMALLTSQPRTPQQEVVYAGLLIRQWKLEEANDTLERVWPVLDPHWQGEALALRAQIFTELLDIDKSAELFYRALILARQAGADVLEAQIHQDLSVGHINSGHYQEAEAALWKSIGIARQAGARYVETTAYLNLAYIGPFLEYSVEQRNQLLYQVCDYCQENWPDLYVVARSFLAQNALEEGDHERARAELEQIRPYWPPFYQQVRVNVLVVWADFLVQEGRVKSALRILRRELANLRPSYRHLVYWKLSELAEEAGELAEAIEYQRQCEEAEAAAKLLFFEQLHKIKSVRY